MIPVKAKKHLGQNFLKNKKILGTIVGQESLENIHIVEVGPGPGDLTEELIKKSPLSLSLIELDQDMIPLLENRFGGTPLNIYLNDVLQMNVIKSGNNIIKHDGMIISREKIIKYNQPYSVYGNIPYYITSPILHHFLYDVDFSPTQAIFTMQKEVADRILARDGNHTVLSLSCQLVADIEKICDISPQNFIPVPKVWSTCLKFTIKEVDRGEIRMTLGIIKKGFSQKRKKLITNLFQHGYAKSILLAAFTQMGISENIRAEELALEQWKALSHSLI